MEEYSNTSYSPLENRLKSYSPTTANSYKANTVVETIFTDRTKSLKSTVNELLAEIERRENLHADLKTRIDDDRSRCGDYLGEAKFWTDNSYNPDNNFLKRKTDLEKQMLSLEEQKRTEDLTCWRDLMFLKKYLMSALKDYWKLTKCRGILEGR